MSTRLLRGWVRLVFFLCLLVGIVPTASAKPGQTVRIGCTQALQMDGSRNLARLENYARSYLDELSKQTDWKYEFHNASYDTCLQMLHRGELDFVFPVEHDEKLGDDIIQTEGYACYALLSIYVRTGDERFSPKQESSMNHCTVGILENEEHQKQFAYYQKKNQWTLTTHVYASRNDLVDALRQGEVDAIVDNGNQCTTDFRLLNSFATLEAAFITTDEKKELANEFNLAMQTSQVTNPDFETWLEQQYLDPVMHRVSAYTEPEREFIRRLIPLRLVFVRDIPPLVEGNEDGKGGKQINGIYVDLLQCLAQDSGLSLEMVEVSSLEEAENMTKQGIADMMLTVFCREDDCQGQYYFTNNLRSESLSVISRKNEKVSFGDTLKVAIPAWMHGVREFISQRHGNWDIEIYDDVDSCLDSVSRNRCDLAVIPQTVLNYEDSLLTYPSLELQVTADFRTELPVCIAISKRHPRLLQGILNKAILHLNPEVINQIQQENMNKGRLSLRFFLSRYPFWSAAAVAFFVLGGMITAFLAYLARMKDQQARTMDEKNQELQMAMRARNHAQFEAETDLLTGLLNRTVMETVCRNFLAEVCEGTTFAFFIVDLDHFKEVNDTYGHQAGDDILKGFAQAVSGVFRKTDCVARFGGDEFVIFAPFVTNRSDLERFSGKILDAARGLTLEDGSQPVTASIGIALAPEHGRTYDQIFRAADTALYRVKESGRNNFCVYEPDMEGEKE